MLLFLSCHRARGAIQPQPQPKIWAGLHADFILGDGLRAWRPLLANYGSLLPHSLNKD